jgi:hypothetical protein
MLNDARLGCVRGHRHTLCPPSVIVGVGIVALGGDDLAGATVCLWNGDEPDFASGLLGHGGIGDEVELVEEHCGIMDERGCHQGLANWCGIKR